MSAPWRLTWMCLLAAAMAPAGAATNVILDEVVRVGAGKVRTLDVRVPPPGGLITSRHHVLEGAAGVRVLLMKREEAMRWLRGRAHSVMAGTPFSGDGSFAHRVKMPGDYQIVLDNRMEGRGAAQVHLRVQLDTGQMPLGPPRNADPKRAQAAVWLGVGLFLTIFATATWKLWSSAQARDVARDAG